MEKSLKLQNELRIFKVQNRRRAKLDKYFKKLEKLKNTDKGYKYIYMIIDGITVFSLAVCVFEIIKF